MVVAQRIVQEIARNRYPPGAQMPSETDMLAQYEVGRETLRQALRFLEINGVIEMKIGPGGGPVVKQPDATALAGTMTLFLQLYGTNFDAIVQVRELLEPSVAALAASRATDEEIAGLRASLGAMEAGIDDEADFLTANDDFHRRVAFASGNTVFALLLASLHWITDGKPVGVDYPAEHRRSILQAHHSIFAAIASRNPGAASEAVQAHNERYKRYLRRYYPNVLTTRLQWSEVTL
jgi:DNA-binding FadR family transcriptional regulator